MRDDRDNCLIQTLRSRFGDQPHRGVEVGVSFGVFSALVLAALPGLQLLMVDRYWLEPRRPYSDSIAKRSRRGHEQAIRQATKATEFAAGRREILVADSIEAARQMTEPVDWVLVDADHSKEATFEDLEAWLPLVRSGGLMFGDDLDSDLGEPYGWDTRGAVEAFAIKHGLRWTMAGHGVAVIEVS